MNYEQAVHRAVSSKSAAYTFLPEKRGTKIVGGQIFIIAYDEDHERDPEEYFEYNIYFSGGLFHSSSGESDTFCEEDAPDEARTAEYLPTTLEALARIDCELQILLWCCEGIPYEQAIAMD